MNTEVRLRPAEIEDLPQIARVHSDSFPESAVTKLGLPIVESYYHWQLTGPHRKVQATLAIVEDECAGFSFSGIFNGSTSGFIGRYRADLVKAVLRRPHLVFNDLFASRLRDGVRLLVRPPKKSSGTVTAARSGGTPIYGILSIAVAPKFQKLGIGQLLMRDVEEEALRFGCSAICLTVHPDNGQALRFYERQNWRKYIVSGTWSGAMTKTLK